MISTSQALEHLLALVAPLDAEAVPLRHACGRVLAKDAIALRTQPPFAASAMDGYAIADPAPKPGQKYHVIGEAAAGHSFGGKIGEGQAVRIFTGAPVPENGQCVVIQEDVTRTGDEISLRDTNFGGANIRPAGGDFHEGSTLAAPRRLSAADIALLAAMNCALPQLTRRPVVSIIATGDELVQPGETPGPDQIIASNSYGLAAKLEQIGATVRLLPIARDSVPALEFALGLTEGSDLIITIGGASVGDHDLVAQAATKLGLERSFYKVRMRPGKPLMAGKLHDTPMIGLPGNPVSAMICGEIFVIPVVEKLLGLPSGPRPRSRAKLAQAIAQNGPREHYMRAQVQPDGRVRVFERQDSALLSVLSAADALVIRAPDAPAADADTKVDVLFI